MLMGIVFVLLLFGWVMLYSASAFVAESRYGNQYFYLKKQILWSGLGLLGLWIAMKVDLKIVQKLSRPVLLVSVAFLIMVLFFGREVAGSRRWLRLGGFGFQPSEFAKLAVVLSLADYLDRKKSHLKDFSSGLVPALILLGIPVLLVGLERDLGTPFLMFTVGIGMTFMAGARLMHMFLLGLLVTPVLYWQLFHVSYRRHRLFSFLNPWADSQGTGYQLVQSFLALGSGGLWGKGSGESTIKLYYLPESQTDFIFSVFGEEWGFIGTSLLTLVFGFLSFRCLKIGQRAPTWFQMLLAVGIGLMLGFQALINLGVVTGLLPTKGIPLPFISFGGSSLLFMMVSMGLVLNVSQQINAEGEREMRRRVRS